MSELSVSLALGSPCFNDPRLEQLATKKGTLHAWLEAFTQLNDKAACGVTGDFSVGLHSPDGRTFLAVDRFQFKPCAIAYKMVNCVLLRALTP